MWATLMFIATVSAEEPDQQVQCAEELNARMTLVLERLQEVQAQQEAPLTITASEPPPPSTTTSATDDSSSSTQEEAPVPLLEEDTSEETDAVAESPV